MIPSEAVYKKTAQGLQEVRARTGKISRDLGLVFLSVDGHASVADLMPISGMTAAQLESALESLVSQGYIEKVGSPAVPTPNSTVPDSARSFLASAPPREPIVPPAPAPRIDVRPPASPDSFNPARNGQITRESAQSRRELDPPPAARPREVYTPGRQNSNEPARAAPQTRPEPEPENTFAGLAQELKARVEAERRSREQAERDARGWAAEQMPLVQTERANADEPQARTVDHNIHSAQRAEASEDTDEALEPFERSSAGQPSTEQADAAGGESRWERNAVRDRADVSSRLIDESSMPTFEEREPLSERVNVDRAAHDVLAHAAEARRTATVYGRNAQDVHQHETDEDARRTARSLRKRRRTRVFGAVAVGLLLAPVLAALWLQFMPINSYIPVAQHRLSERLNQPTTISTLRYVLLPTPRLVLEGVTIGKGGGIRIERVQAPALPHTLLEDVVSMLDAVDADGVTIDAETLLTLPAMTAPAASAVKVKRLRLSEVKLNRPEGDLKPMQGEITFAPNGSVKQVVLANDHVKIDVSPRQSGAQVTINVTDSRAPFGPALKFSYLTIDGVADRQQFTATQVSGRLAGGTVEGTLRATWDGAISVKGEFKLQNARLHEVMAPAEQEFSARGIVKASGRYAVQAANAEALMSNPLVESTFSVSKGELTNIDLVRAAQSAGSTFSGGRTGFDELTGSLQVAGGNYSYRQLRLASGPLNATGYLAVTAAGQLSGRVDVQVAPSGAAATRASLNIGGSAKEPQITR